MVDEKGSVRRVTYSMLLHNGLPHWVQAHDRLLLLLGPGPSPLVLLAAWMRSAVACPMDTRSTPAAAVDAAQQLKCKWAYVDVDVDVDQSLADALAEAGVGIINVSFHIDGDDPIEYIVQSRPTSPSLSSSTSSATLSSSSDPTSSASNLGNFASGDQPILLLRTSGTTGKAKVVPLTSRALYFNARALASSMALTRADVSLLAMPLFHIGGISCPLLATLVTGATLVVPTTRFDPARFFELLPTATWFYAAPTIHKALVLHARANKVKPHRLRFVRSGAAHLPHNDAVAIARLFGCPVMPTYSMSECMPICSVPPVYDLSVRDTVGSPIGPSLRIAGDDGKALPYGEVGHVLVRGAGVMAGYEREDGDPEDGSEFVRGWLRTGDLGMLDTDGNVFLRGRSKEVIKRGGEQISLHEVDEALLAIDGVDVAVSFPVVNEFWGEECQAVVVCRRPISEDEVLRSVSGALEAIKVPRKIFILDDTSSLPKSSTGKYQRSKFASALGAQPVDVQAAAALAGADVKPSRALYGIRLILAYWVAQTHIGSFPSAFWSKARSTTQNMTGFMLLAGFLLAASTTRGIPAGERRSFFVSRLAATHPLFVFAILYAIPTFFLSCYGGYHDKVGNCAFVSEGPGLAVPFFILAVALHLTGFHTLVWSPFIFLGPSWFQTAYYVLVLFFPRFDGWLRGMAYAKLRKATFILLALASTYFAAILAVAGGAIFIIQFSFSSWIFTFLSGIGLWHMFLRNGRLQLARGEAPGLKWALITDLISLLFLAILVIVGFSDCVMTFDTPPVYSCPDLSYDEWLDSEVNEGGRWNTIIGTYWGNGRINTVFMGVWIYGLAKGKGVTAAIFANRYLVRYLSPLAYGLYLLHVPTAAYMWYALKGRTEDYGEFINQQGGVVFPLPVWAFFVVIAVSLLLTACFNEFLNPILIPFSTKFYQFIFNKIFGCCFTATTVVEDDGASAGTFGLVRKTIRDLTGSDVKRETALDGIGLDSFGTTALVGSLRRVIPAARNLRPVQVIRLATVQDLVEKLDALGADDESTT